MGLVGRKVGGPRGRKDVNKPLRSVQNGSTACECRVFSLTFIMYIHVLYMSL